MKATDGRAGRTAAIVWMAVACWTALALMLWAARSFATDAGPIGTGWTVRNEELSALFASHDGAEEEKPAAPTASGKERKDGASGAATNEAGGKTSREPPSPSGPSASPASPEPAAAPAGAIDINRAGADELDGLPGIGPAKAKAIVEHRERHGPFRSVEELKNVKGIGDKTFESLKELVTAGAVSR
ncbi:ComEA family DNA-binding protein [Paenibacillus flagellatus]|uniref:Helix-hairpin-helix DNA-binding motif class 1 domain-containing protein n=1 Tax=Paenibacillus flagellatus TaxID=2211139 RepID=A0A2V5JYC2_9BACL|nr:helix-hairpin-helix domain-containing protein [Paenibacillus flagellatus]PYI51879.1 hypothetical protein DLM86_23485 [Paenibacillus flagellatus]